MQGQGAAAQTRPAGRVQGKAEAAKGQQGRGRTARAAGQGHKQRGGQGTAAQTRPAGRVQGRAEPAKGQQGRGRTGTVAQTRPAGRVQGRTFFLHNVAIVEPMGCKAI